MEAREHQSCYQNHIPLAICNICSSNFHGNDACPMLLDNNFYGEAQMVGDLQGQYSYIEEQPIWPYQQFQQNASLKADTQSYLEEIIKQMAENNKQMTENNLQFQQQMQSMFPVKKVQGEQVISSVHQIQENVMFHDDVQPVASLELTRCDTSLDEISGEPIKTVFVSYDELIVKNKHSSECMKQIMPQNFLKSDLDELYTSLEVDNSLEIVACECGVCNVCLEISAAILCEDSLMPTTTCAEILANSTTLEFDKKNVDFCHKQPLSIAEFFLVETLIKPNNMVFSFTICASLPHILSESQAKCEFSIFHTFVIAGLPYVQTIPPKPPDFLLISKFTCYLLFSISCVRSAERAPPKSPDMKATFHLNPSGVFFPFSHSYFIFMFFH